MIMGKMNNHLADQPPPVPCDKGSNLQPSNCEQRRVSQCAIEFHNHDISYFVVDKWFVASLESLLKTMEQPIPT